MTIDTLIQSEDIYVLFDGCPTCHPESSKYLDKCRMQAQKTRRQLHVIPSGSQTATLMRLIAQNQRQHVEYPMILTNGIIRYDPQDITERSHQ
nr:MAG: hypothetical protein [Bacteriophage sp.]